MNTYRKMLVEYIRDNCGYSNRHGRYALSWDVSTYKANIDFDACFARCMKEDDRFSKVNKDAFEEYCNWNNENHYEYCLEDMQRGVLDGENSTYNTYGPNVAKRFGLSYYREYSKTYKPSDKFQRINGDLCYYPANKKGWKKEGQFDIRYFDVEFGLAGSQSKHLVIKKFEGIYTDLSCDDLADDIENDDCGNYSNEWCKNLLVMIIEWNSVFTTENVAKDLEYRMDDYMVQVLDEYLLNECVEEEAA